MRTGPDQGKVDIILDFSEIEYINDEYVLGGELDSGV